MTSHLRQPEIRAMVRLIRDDVLDDVGKMMLDSARVFAASGDDIPVEYIQRINARRNNNPRGGGGLSVPAV